MVGITKTETLEHAGRFFVEKQARVAAASSVEKPSALVGQEEHVGVSIELAIALDLSVILLLLLLSFQFILRGRCS